MSENLEEPGPSRIKRKSSDPGEGHGEIKYKAEDKSVSISPESNETRVEEATDDVRKLTFAAILAYNIFY